MLAICFVLSTGGDAEAGCGYAHLRPHHQGGARAPLAVGDSVMLGAAPQLRRAGIEVEARCARPPREGVELIERRRRNGTLPDEVVVALGTNIQLGPKDIGRMLRAIGRDRGLVLVTPLRAGHAYGAAVMRRAARAHPGRVVIADWARAARGRKDWLWGDNTHLRPAGAAAYTRLIRRQVFRRGRFGRDLRRGRVANCGSAHIRPNRRVGDAPLALGDSVMLGAAGRLARAGFEVDAQCGRSPDRGTYILRRRARRGTLPPVVVIALGTNWFMESRDIGAMLRVLGPSRTLVLVTPFRSWRPVGGGPIRAAAARRPGRIELADWSSLATGRGWWFVGDGTHLRASGAQAYAGLIRRVAWGVPRGRLGGV